MTARLDVVEEYVRSKITTSPFFTHSLSFYRTHTHTKHSPCSLTHTNSISLRASDLWLLNVLCTSEMTAHTTRPALQSGFHMITRSSTVRQTRYNRSVCWQGNSPGIPLNPTVSNTDWAAQNVQMQLVVFLGEQQNRMQGLCQSGHRNACSSFTY